MILKQRPRLLGREIYVDEQVILANPPAEDMKKGIRAALSTHVPLILLGGAAWFFLKAK